MAEAIGSVLFLLAGFLLVLFLAYWATRMLGKRYESKLGAGAIELLDRAALGQDQALLVVRVAKKTLLIGTTPHGIQTLAELDDANLSQIPNEPAVPFAESLRVFLRQRAEGDSQHKEA